MTDRRQTRPGDQWVTDDQGHVIGVNVGGQSGTPSTFQTLNAVTKTASTTLKRNETTVRGNAAGGAIVLTLPLNPLNGDRHVIKKTDASANTVTISGNGRLIDGAATNVISTQYASISLFYDFSSNTWNIE